MANKPIPITKEQVEGQTGKTLGEIKKLGDTVSSLILRAGSPIHTAAKGSFNQDAAATLATLTKEVQNSIGHKPVEQPISRADIQKIHEEVKQESLTPTQLAF